jgi:hypothetical protein
MDCAFATGPPVMAQSDSHPIDFIIAQLPSGASGTHVNHYKK